MRFPIAQALFSVLSQITFGPLLATDVVIVSNNDLDPSNLNRASALLLTIPLDCAQAISACASLRETLLPPPTDTGFIAHNLTTVLTSGRHGAALAPSSSVWIAASSDSGCATFTLGNSPSDDDITITGTSSRLPALCTNSAPLTRSNVTAYDTTRQIDVSTPKAGILRGFRDRFTWRFLGIEYAASISGKNRFQPPTPLDIRPNTVRDALTYGPPCAQGSGYVMYTEEDCLSLNVYSPIARGGSVTHAAPKLPVMFYIHGGGFNTGSSGPFAYNMTTDGYVGDSISNMYDGTNLVSYGGVVLVTVNYRLTAFGWFNASNAALKDILLALHWVQDNIESFGGDPTKVLIFGESAGGTMTRYLLGMNQRYTKGLFSAAILVSDYSTLFSFYSSAPALNTSLELAKHLGCASDTSTSLSATEVICVQDKPVASLVVAAYSLDITWGAVVDGDYILDDLATSIRNGMYARVPTLWSTTECDACFFLPHVLSPIEPPSAYVRTLPRYFNQTQIAKLLNETTLYPYETAPPDGGMSGAVVTLAELLTDWMALCPSTYLASLQSNTTNPGNAYHAVFAVGLASPATPNPTMCRGRVCHADDLYYIFGTAETDGLHQPLTPQQVGVMREVMKRWTEMAWSGSPNYEGAEVVWEEYGAGKEMVVSMTESVRDKYRVEQCDFIANELGLVYKDGMH